MMNNCMKKFFILTRLFYLYKNIKIMYVIVKEMVNQRGMKVHVILINGQSEIWEFDTYEEADRMRTVFQNNSDSGYKYTIKKIGQEE